MLTIRPMRIHDHDQAMSLWTISPGIGLSAADSRDKIHAYLERNPGLSHCAWNENILAGTVLAGHDGRRGYLHHLCVHPDYRRQGLGRKLVHRALLGLETLGIDKAHIFLFTDNENARAFWTQIGWTWRCDIGVVSRVIGNTTL